MRSKRITKFGKKNRFLMIVLKMSFIFYLILFMAGYVTSSTTAYFSSESEISQKITSATWSDLDFVGTDLSSSDETCSVSATLMNKGEADMEDASYTVYYAEEGNPETEDEHEPNGTINRLEPGESVELTYNTEKPGVYQFSAEQADNHPNEQTIWSDTITTECVTESDDDENEVENEEHEEDEDGVENENNDKEGENEKGDDEEDGEDDEEENEDGEGDEEKKTSDDTDGHHDKTEQDDTEEDDDDSDDQEEKEEETSENQEQPDQSNGNEEKGLEKSQTDRDKEETSKPKSEDPENKDLEKKNNAPPENPKDTEEASSSEKTQGNEVDQ